MSDEVKANYAAWIADVEKINDVPVVLAQWGYKKVVLNGKTYLAPMTEEDARAAYSELGIEFSQGPHCSRDPLSGCHPQAGCRGCTDHPTSGGYICVCTR